MAFIKRQDTKASWRHEFIQTQASTELAEMLGSRSSRPPVAFRDVLRLNLQLKAQWSSKTYDLKVFSFGSGTIPEDAYVVAGEYVAGKIKVQS